MATKIKKNNNNTIIFDNDTINQINVMLKDFSTNKDLEFEISFRNIDYPNYMRICEHYIDVTDRSDIESTNSLDINVTLTDLNTYRVSLYDSDDIDNFIQKFSKSSLSEILKYLLSINPSDNNEIMYKNRGKATRLHVDDWNIIIKTTPEIPVDIDSKPKTIEVKNIIYRYKTRYSFKNNNNVRIDLTDVKSSNNISKLITQPSNYELEIEIINRKINSDILLEQIENVLKIVQDTEIPINKTETREVINSYQKLLDIKFSNHLDSRNVISISSHHIVEFVPNKYAVTDKADGERYFLYSTSIGIYLLSTNLAVKKLNLPILDKKFQNMLLDGEYIKTDTKELLMIFDVVYAEGIDYRYNDSYNLSKRIIVINNIIDKCFDNLIPFTDYTDEHNNLELDTIKDFYSKEINNYWKLFNKQLNKSSGLFITRKLYFVPYGIESSEVFMYADLIWKMYVYNELTPYILDGIIYTPINTPYMIKVSNDQLDTIPLEYKWKPPHQNSIDFYIRFKKDVNGMDAIYYDNAEDRAEGKPYKICVLYVGLNKQGQEIPIPFKVKGTEQTANIYVVNDEAQDSNGIAINDNTVVEFIFDPLKIDMDDGYKWIPIRTRYDKTESVQKYQKKYGNNLQIAIRIWKTIISPVTEDSIAALANPLTYDKEISKLSESRPDYNKQKLVYYQKDTSNAAGMRSFNNWIKSSMISTYCKNIMSALDIGCGRGGDLIKFINANVGEYVGIDIDNNGLYVINDSANNRYKNLKKKMKNVPPMYFINADARGLFTVNAQEKILPSMPESNKILIDRFLDNNKKYDAINCQFSLHYYLSDDLSWSNFCENINNQLKDNGYFLVTSFDGKLVFDSLKNKTSLSSSYTDDKGNKNIFFEIKKMYSDKDKNQGIGMGIDLYNSLISNPGTYNREYLVFPDFLEKSLKEKCGLELIESDSFYGIFNLYKNYFKKEYNGFALNNISFERHKEIREFYLSLEGKSNNDVETDIALASFKLSMLNRYYVFRKTTKVDVSQPARIYNEINHKTDLGKILMPYFETNNMIIDHSSVDSNINNLYRMIKNKYKTIKPSVYLIRHTINENNLSDILYSTNKLEFSKIKQGSDPKILLIYKSPNKQFYPLYYQQYDTVPVNLDNIYLPDKGTYLLDSNKIINDLNILVSLSDRYH
ncbi:putative mRNA-capping enzyme [Cotonvirus japonicus]|uniref:mRNA-capping enzyme n=1 Tax=Cotonvirus japonicus TaxID=2811091 RepID=A0ABM7NSQ0_9VIRU|nr:putative mRNA-capping enzyme [Cotonvirus japonicus]BCS83173.1 putative mRNA-capping enzyme [Cotonvirus japonicus]